MIVKTIKSMLPNRISMLLREIQFVVLLIIGALFSACTTHKNVKIATGKSTTCAISEKGALKCWGAGAAGKLGNGKKGVVGTGWFEMGPFLPDVNLGTGRTVKSVSLGNSHACAILDNGRLKCWGRNDDGRLGLGDTNNRGDEPGEMGDNLPYVRLGKGLTVQMVSLGRKHSCALLSNYKVKCWGVDIHGSLGLEGKRNYGANPDDMGDQLPYVDLGKGRTVKSIAVGYHHSCAILDNDLVKCWGAHRPTVFDGNRNKGDEPNEMGDNLTYIDLGKNRTAKAIAAGISSTCAILDNDRMKCWGGNLSGSLGLGTKESFYFRTDMVGDKLPYVDLGTEQFVKKISVGSTHVCAILINDKLKCWGDNHNGELGLRDTNDRGDDPGEMGDSLPYIDLGVGRTVKKISISLFHNCAILDNNLVKCWGYNGSYFGTLGLGNSRSHGSQKGEMGDNLPYVNIFNYFPWD